MPLQEQYVELPLTGGLDEKANKEGAVNGFLQLDNYEFSDDADSLRPRHGFKRVELFTTSNEHGFVSSGDAYTRVSSGLSHRSLGTTWNGRRVLSSDSAVSASQILVVTEEYLETESTDWTSTYPNRLVTWALRDRTTWKAVATGSESGTGTGAFSPRAVLDTDGSTFLLLWCEGTLGSGGAGCTLKVDKITNAGSVSTVTISTNVASEVHTAHGSGFDAWTSSGGLGATVIAWNSTDGNIKLAKFTAAGGVTTTFNDTTSTTGSACTVAVTVLGTTVVVLYSDSSNIHASVYPGSIASRTRGTKGGTPVFAGSNKSVTLASDSPGTTTVWCACSSSNGLMCTTYDTANNNLAGGSTTKRMAPVTKVFNTSYVGVQYFDTIDLTTSFPSILIVDLTQIGLVGQVAFEESTMVAGTEVSVLPSVAGEHLVGPFTLTVPVTEETPDAVSIGVPVCRARTVELTLATGLLPTAKLCNVGFVVGSFPRIWDGTSFKPAAAPAVALPPTLSSTGTGLTGTFAYCVVLEYSDAFGNIQVSPPSVVSTITVTNKTIVAVIDVPKSLFVAGFTGTVVRTKLYRTTNAGSTFYLVRSFIQSSESLTVNDALADATLSSYEIIYTTSELASELGPPLLALTPHRNRLFGIRSDNPRTIAYTQETTDPELPRWNSVLTLEVDNTAGDPIALASLDDKVLVFQRDQIVAVNGQGPDRAGSGAFSIPEVVARGVGVNAANRNSVVVFPDGVMFRHTSGIYAIGRDLSVQPVGLAIQRTLGPADVWCARYFPSRHQVWMLLDPATYTGGGTCPILVFDVRYGRWSTFTPSFTNVRDAIEVAGVVYVLEASATNGVSGRVFQLDTTSFVDKLDGTTPTYLPLTVQLPWFRGAGRNGTQRLRRIGLHGQAVNGTGVGVVVDTYTQKNQELAKNAEVADSHYAFGASLIGALPAGGFSLPLRVATQRCSAFRLKITITPTSTDAESLRLTSISMSYGAEPAKGKAPVGRKPTAS